MLNIIPRPVRLHVIAVMTALLLAGGASDQAAAQESPRAVVLKDVPPGDGVSGGLLIREIVRQAVLITARDEFGLLTRDATLGETVPTGSKLGTEPLLISVDSPGNETVTVLISMRKPDADDPVELTSFQIEQTAEESISNLTAHMEAMTRKELIDLLEKAGHKRQVPEKPAADKATPDVSEKIKQQLSQMSCLVQYAAVRALHTEIRKSGESPALLAALARGYAHLGTLTELNWSPAHKVFKARALLYAERLVVKNAGFDELGTRAYVRALVGLPGAAVEDLQQLEELGAEKTPPVERPAEADLIRAFCHGDADRLTKAAFDGPHQLLARYLRMLIAEYSTIYPLRQRTADSVLQLDPRNLRALEGMTHGAPLGILRSVAVTAPKRFLAALSPELSEIADLPQKIQERLKETSDEHDERISQVVELTQDLLSDGTPDEAGGELLEDSVEPSLMVVGNLVREAHFLHAWRLLSVQRYALAVNADEDLQRLLPLVEGHRYEEFLEAHAWDPQAVVESLQVLAQVTGNPHLEATQEPMLALMAQARIPIALKLRADSLSHDDVVVRDLIDRTRRASDPSERSDAATALFAISPESPSTIAIMIDHNWESVAELAEPWEKEYASDVVVQDMLARRYAALSKFTEAERCLRRRIEALPDFDAYKRLAALNLAQGDVEGWVQTMTKSLTLESQGLEHAQARVALAKHFAKQKDLKKACEYADEAAKSWSAWALLCAAECHEQAGNFEKSETYVRELSQRYPGVELSWYFWCRRTGQGDITAARKQATKLLDEFAESDDLEKRTLAAMFHYSEGRSDQALELLQEIFDKSGDPTKGMLAALLADELDKTDVRDKLLEQTQQSAYARGGNFGEMVQAIRNSLRAEGAIPLDLKILEVRIHIQADGEATRRYFCLGKLLLQHGREEEGLRYLQRAASSPVSVGDASTWAGITLARRDIPREPLRMSEWAGDDKFEQILTLVKQGYTIAQAGQLDAAVPYAERALEIDPQSIDALLLRAALSTAKMQMRQSLADYTRCKEVLPNSTDVLFGLAGCHEFFGDYPAAIAAYEEAIKINPYQGNGYKALAHLWSTANDAKYRDGKKAVEYARRSLTMTDNITEVQKLIVLSMALAETGDFPEAIKTATLALQKTDPRFHPQITPVIDLFRKGKPFRRPPVP